jgi:hypothetical protein
MMRVGLGQGVSNMRIAAAGWLHDLFSSTAMAQSAFGPDWAAVVTLATLVDVHLTLGALSLVSGVTLVVVATAAMGYVIIRYGEAELFVVPVDDLRLPIHVAEESRILEAKFARVLQLNVRGNAIERYRTA